MKSKQLNFFIVPKDYETINNFLTTNGVIVYCDKSLNDENYNPLCITNTDDIHQFFLSKEEFSDEISIKILDNGLRYFYITSSNLLEFNVGGFYPYDEKTLNRGRLYFIQGFYDDDKFVMKSDVFNDWAESFIKIFKKTFLVRYSKEKDFWYSKNAIDWIESKDAKLIDGGQQWKASN